MKKKLSLFLTLLMLTMVILIPQAVSAATVPYQTIRADSDDVPREKVGSYYIWTKDTVNSQGVRTGSKLLLSKDGKTTKTLKSLKGKTKSIAPVIVTNGSTIYYAVDSGNDTGTIYKTTYTGKKHTKIKTAKYLGRLAAYYNNKIYYSCATEKVRHDSNLHSYNLETKKSSVEKKHFLSEFQYGQYLTGGDRSFDVRNTNHYILNLKTGKINKLPEAGAATTDGKKVYYWKYTSYDTMEREIKTCSLTGKNAKTIKKLPSGGYPLYFGKTTIYVDASLQVLYGTKLNVSYGKDAFKVGNVTLKYGTYKSTNFSGTTITVNKDGTCKYHFPKEVFESFGVNTTGTWNISEMENYGVIEPTIVFELKNGESEPYVIRTDNSFANQWITFAITANNL